MLFNPFQVLRRLRPPFALGRPLRAPTLPLVLALHAIRSYARHDNSFRRSRRSASGQSGSRAAVDGKWRLVLATPLGRRNSILSLKAAGSALTGRQSADGNSAEIFDGMINGNEVAWKVSITVPMPLTIQFEGTVRG